MKQTTCYQFLIHVCWDHQEGKPALRAFKTEKAARAWIESEHESRWNKETDSFRTEAAEWAGRTFQHSLGFEIADLYRILPSGEIEEVDQYQAWADKDGNALGWVNK